MSEPIRVSIIMAGGSGERFWPLSRMSRPKQLLCLTDEKLNMLEESVGRVSGIIPPENVFVITSRMLQEPIRQGRSGLAPENILAEPCKRNTSGCLAYGAAHVMAKYGRERWPEITMAILTADHRIGGDEAFRATVQAALAAVESEPALATMGAVPDRPETGYGYIEIGEGAAPLALAGGLPPVYPVACFREKPDRATAETFVATGRHFWNTGMFFWRLETFLDELSHTQPGLNAAIYAMADALSASDTTRFEEIFAGIENISIDYALMEKARRVVMARAAFDWDDVGAWDALDRGYPHDEAGNVTSGDPVLIDTRDCIVYNEPGAEKIAVATIGVEGLAVIVSEDGILVVPKDRAQDVRQAVAKLKERGGRQV